MRSVLVILCLLLSAMAMQPAASAGISYLTGDPNRAVTRRGPRTGRPYPGRACCGDRCCSKGCC